MDKNKEKLLMPPVTVPFKWLVGVLMMSAGSLGSLAAMFIWVGNTSGKVEAHDRDILRLRDTMKERINRDGETGARLVRIETILEYAFPKEAERAPKISPNTN